MPPLPPSALPFRNLLVLDGDAPFAARLEALIEAHLPGTVPARAGTLAEGLARLAGGGIDGVLLGLGPEALGPVLSAGGTPAVLVLAEGEEEAFRALRGGAQEALVRGEITGPGLARALRLAQARRLGREEAETRRRESEGLLASTLDAMKAAIAIADPQGRLTLANSAWRGSESPLVPPWTGRGLDYAAFCRSLDRGGEGIPGAARGILAVLDGTEARFVQDFQWGEGASAAGCGVTAFSFQVEGSRRVGIAIADTTERFLTERRLRESELEIVRAHAIKNLILENSTLGIAFVQMRVFEWANNRFGEILGRPMDEILGGPTRIAYPDEDSFERMGRTAYPGMERGETSDLVWTLQRGDGSTFPCRMIGRPLDPTNPNQGSVWMVEDITERLKAEQLRLSLEVQLRHAQKLEAIGQLAAGIAHEINTPTQYIGDNARFLAGAFADVFRVMEALAEPGGDPEALRRIQEEADLPFLREEIPKAIEQSLEGIARVTRIVRAMKDFSHPGSENPVDVDLNQAIESTVTVSRNEWKYVAELVLDLDPALGLVACYPNEMNQAVLNLVINAAHAIAEAVPGEEGPRGTITVTTARDGDMAEIRVRDTGTGIPEGVQSRIFDPFFTTKAVGKGTGQGLAIVHSVVVERHKGTVAFETEPGAGSVFILRIPVAGPPR